MKLNDDIHHFLKNDNLDNQLNEKRLISHNLNYKKNLFKNSLFQNYNKNVANSKKLNQLPYQKSLNKQNDKYNINNSLKTNNNSHFNTITKSTNITNTSHMNLTNYKLDNHNKQYLYDKKFEKCLKEFFPYDFKHKSDTKQTLLNKVTERNKMNMSINNTLEIIYKKIKIKKNYPPPINKPKINFNLDLSEKKEEKKKENDFNKIKKNIFFQIDDDEQDKNKNKILKKKTMKFPTKFIDMKDKFEFNITKIKSKQSFKNFKNIEEEPEKKKGLIKANKLLKAISNIYESEYEPLNKKNGDLISLNNLARIIQLKKIQKNYLQSQDNIELDRNAYELGDEGRRLKRLIEKLGGPRFFKYDFKIKTINEYNDWIGRGFGLSRTVEKFEKGRNPQSYLKGIQMYKIKNNIK
jgi:hypothetical protein